MKKNIKKLAAIFLAAVMMIGVLPFSAFAEEESRAVTASTSGVDPYNVDASSEYAMISVSVEWGDLNFNYNFGSIWNPATHSYDAAEGEKLGWNKTSTDVVVTNDSNIAVDVSIAFAKTANDAFESVNAAFNKTSSRIASAADGSSYSDTFTLSISGTPDKACPESVEFGVITVSFSAAARETAGTEEIEEPAGVEEPLVSDEPADEPTDEPEEYWIGGSHDGDDNDT